MPYQSGIPVAGLQVLPGAEHEVAAPEADLRFGVFGVYAFHQI